MNNPDEQPIQTSEAPMQKELAPRERPADTNRRLGRAILFGAIALIFGIIGLLAFNIQLVFLPAMTIAVLAGMQSYRHFKRRHVDATEFLDAHDKAPVLFLRPFDQDSLTDGAAPFNPLQRRTWRKFILSPTNLLANYLQITGRFSYEQVLAFVTRKIGPLAAIGQPGSPPIMGARNIYVGDDNWQEEVLELAENSQLVILTAGITPGVLWEVEQMVKLVPGERLILNIPGKVDTRRKALYAEFYNSARHFFPKSLPEAYDGRRFLLFDNEWAVQPPLKRTPRAERHSPEWVAQRMTQLLL